MRQRILYADVQWRQMRPMGILLLLVGPVLTVTALLEPKWRFLQPAVGWLVYIPASLLFLLALWIKRSRTDLEVGSGALKVNRLLFRPAVISFGQIRSVRIEPLKEAFESKQRQRMLQPFVELRDRPALFIRLQPGALDEGDLRRRLDKLYLDGDMLAFPLESPQAMLSELKRTLPQGTSPSNLGGARRGRKR